MPPEEKSHSQTSAARPRVTDTHGPYEVGDFRVLRVGGIVALHLGTPAGRFIFHLRERSFVSHARAEFDDQGNPFRDLATIDAERNRLRADADNPPAELAREKRDGMRSKLSGADIAACRRILTLHETSGETFERICSLEGFSYTRFMNWKNGHRIQASDGNRPPVLKPGGHLL